MRGLVDIREVHYLYQIYIISVNFLFNKKESKHAKPCFGSKVKNLGNQTRIFPEQELFLQSIFSRRGGGVA